MINSNGNTDNKFMQLQSSNNKDMAKLQLEDFETHESFNCVMWEEALLNTSIKML